MTEEDAIALQTTVNEILALAVKKRSEIGGAEVAPLLWTPHRLGFWSPQWQRSTHLTRRNSAGR
jgi:hypothetical protein